MKNEMFITDIESSEDKIAETINGMQSQYKFNLELAFNENKKTKEELIKEMDRLHDSQRDLWKAMNSIYVEMERVKKEKDEFRKTLIELLKIGALGFLVILATIGMVNLVFV